jgi:hypothetical protein
VTIIGWGQSDLDLSLSDKARRSAMHDRWWFLIPHLGPAFGESCGDI